MGESAGGNGEGSITEDMVRDALAHLYDSAYLRENPLLPLLVRRHMPDPLARTLGAAALLKKPVGREQLLNAVADIIGI